MSRELLFTITAKDMDIEHIRGSGPGGQHRNKTSTGVRMKHRASGVVVEATDDRSQDRNKRNAFTRLAAHPDFKKWLRLAAADACGMEPIATRVEREMAAENIRTQVLDERDHWVDVDPLELLD